MYNLVVGVITSFLFAFLVIFASREIKQLPKYIVFYTIATAIYALTIWQLGNIFNLAWNFLGLVVGAITGYYSNKALGKVSL
ncbi:hypothetical protein [Stygiolobus caldivivus]|uniref:Uncharacterized protein n=1 Tax=Stygiolobus caldivivus TaxID=2824673 RepID=A0A8D5U5C5_9CREN|nr:hypothetical protein [Stygiolobus caldivivus]BCU69589.1 hypothetical protein KN1_08860 [Stygiolobus caldivivus]